MVVVSMPRLNVKGRLTPQILLVVEYKSTPTRDVARNIDH